MTQIVNPSIDRVADSFLTAGSLAYAGLRDGGIVPSGEVTELAKQSAIDETVLDGFSFSTSSSSLDVTISPGEAFVFGSWLAKDTTTTVTLPPSSTINELILTWEKNSANTVQIGIPSDFDEFPDSDEYILLGSFLTDSNGVTQSQDQREFVSVDAERLEGKDTSEITPDISDDGATVVENVDDINVEGGLSASNDGDGSVTIVGEAQYTDTDAINAIDSESSLSVNISGDANSVDGFSFVKDGNSGPGIINYQTGIEATGGTTVIDRTINGVDYRIHAFESVGSDTFSVNQAPSDATVDVLVVAGGGSGGPKIGAGGGAGGLVFKSNISVTSGSFLVNVGEGAPRLQPSSNIDYSESSHGGNSSAFGLTAKRGGLGGSHRAINDNDDTDGTDGGSGGGAGDPYKNGTSPGNATQPGTNPSAEIDAGNIGGFPISNSADSGSFPRRSAGGGGAGEVGQEESYGGTDATGGDGIDMSNQFGTSFGESGVFAGGGGGFYFEDSGISFSQYEGGLGGGGDAADNIADNVNVDGGNAQANTGGGGGGGSWKQSQGGAGGSGIVLIRYEI